MAAVNAMDALEMLAPSSLAGCIDLATAPWPQPVPVAASLSGEPVTQTLSIVDAPEFTAGLWRCTPGSYLSTHEGYVEFLHVLEGQAEVRGHDGVVWALGPGTSLVIPDGWAGTWDITETVVKTFTIYRRFTSAEPQTD